MNRSELFDTLFFIANAEMAKSEKEMNADVVLSCVEAAGSLDARFRSSAEERAAFADSITGGGTAVKRRKGLSRRAVFIIAAVVAALVIGSIAVYALTDVFSLFFDDPREILEWNDGESRRIENYEMIVSFGAKEYASTDELVREFGGTFICPAAPEGFEVTEVYSIPLEGRREASVKYDRGENQVQLTVLLDRDKPTGEELASSGSEMLETRNGNTFYLTESEVGWQATARIGGNVYVIDGAEKDDVVRFIESAGEF